MTTKKKLSTPLHTKKQHISTSGNTSVSEVDKIARSVVEQNISIPSAACEADVVRVKRFLADKPELLTNLKTQVSGVKGDVEKIVEPTLESNQIVNMARLHFVTQASIASSDHLRREIDRYLKESGIF